MAIEGLIRPTIDTIDSLRFVETESESAAMRIFKDLQKSALWDSEHEQWRHYMDENQALWDSDHYATDQLLGVLVEGAFNRHNAWRRYGALKQSRLYDTQEQQWQWFVSEDLNDDTPKVFWVKDKLLAVLVEGLFDKETAREYYLKLKESDFYDKEMQEWGGYLDADMEFCSEACYAGAQLTGVLVEGLFDVHKAREIYMQLQQTDLFDREKRQWLRNLPEVTTFRGVDRLAEDQLLGILVEGMFDMNNAKDLYMQLKETDLYDSERKQWKVTMTKNQQVVDTDRLTRGQLLGVLVERMFEDKHELLSDDKPIPMVRKF